MVLISGFSDNLKLAALSVISILGVLTRFSLPIWLAIALVLFTQRKIRIALALMTSAFLATIPTYLTQPEDAVLPGTKGLSGFEKLVALPISFFKVAFIEIAQLAALDRVLLIFFVASCIVAIFKVHEVENKYFIFVALAVFGIGAINGVLGVNFRYQLPLIPFMAWTILANASRINFNR